MSAAKKKNELFSEVRIPSERKRIYSELVQSRGAIILKGPRDQLSFLNPIQLLDFQFLKCVYQVDSPRVSPQDSLVDHFVQFSVGTDRYYFNSSATPSDQFLTLTASDDLYQLQRRSSLRISLPWALNTRANIISKNDLATLTECRVLDISTGGIKAEFDSSKNDHTHWKTGDSLVMMLHLGKRIPFQIEGIIRYLSPITATDHGPHFHCGIEFINKSTLLENKLLSIQMDIQSEIFRKLKKYNYG